MCKGVSFWALFSRFNPNLQIVYFVIQARLQINLECLVWQGVIYILLRFHHYVPNCNDNYEWMVIYFYDAWIQSMGVPSKNWPPHISPWANRFSLSITLNPIRFFPFILCIGTSAFAISSILLLRPHNLVAWMRTNSFGNQPKYSSSSSIIRGTIDGVIVATTLVSTVAWVSKFCKAIKFWRVPSWFPI